jgi:1-deoxy-D-xylulose 5-phosphate reductoisomerase
MKINIFGSTGIIGDKSLKLISKLFPKIQINLLVANNNYNKLIKQCNLYSPKYVCIKNSIYINKIKNNINNKIKIIEYKNLNIFLKTKKSEITILSISGYQALDYFESILKNTKFLGLVNKETIVSIGHLFRNSNFKKNTIFFPLDSEHFSLFDFFSNNKTDLNKVKKIYLTASGGPFLNYNIKQLRKVKFGQAIKHPKWKMGYKNSIDSATLANKCLELIEAHYLFNIPYKKTKILDSS